jgi:hypothetical protein
MTTRQAKNGTWSIGLLVLVAALAAGCGGLSGDGSGQAADGPASGELRAMYEADQASRVSRPDDPLEMTDKDRRRRVMELLSRGAVVTAEDKYHAAVILQHTPLRFCGGELASSSPENYYLAHLLARESLNMGHEGAREMVAKTLDRFLLFTEGQQKYGTQRTVDPKTGKETLAPIDPGTTDEERAELGVPPLEELRRRYPAR